MEWSNNSERAVLGFWGILVRYRWGRVFEAVEDFDLEPYFQYRTAISFAASNAYV